MNENITEDWALYQAGKNYNNQLEPNYYDTVDANLAFFEGNQWRNLKADNMPKPVFNIIKRVTSFFIASLTSSKIKMNFEPLLYSDVDTNAQMELEMEGAKFANAQVDNLLEKFKFDFMVKEAGFDAAITGDACAHFYFDMSKKPFGNAYGDIKGEIVMELVDGTNVYFGNANTNKVDVQPYIIITGRDMVKNLQEEAKRYQQADTETDPSTIQRDFDYEHMAGDSAKFEVESDQYGKALYIIIYRKQKIQRPVMDEFGQPAIDPETGEALTEEVETITASKSVENAYIYKDIDTGLSHYPIAWMNWEKQKNQYHGRALITGMLPNQIFINRMFAMVMYHLMMTAFPKAVFNKDIVSSWSNEIGAAIGISGMGPEHSIKNIAGYLEPGNMSTDITNTIEMAMQYTKETLGISDAALGQIDPKNTSAIIAVQKSSSIPLENPRSNLYEWVEDIGRILFDMMGTYYGTRPIVMEEDGQKVMKEFDFSQFKDMWLNVRADVGESSYWSEISSIETLSNMLNEGHIDIIDFLERIPDDYIPQKQELLDKINQSMQQQAMANNSLIAQLSPEEQQRFMSAPPEVQQEILAQVQGGGVSG